GEGDEDEEVGGLRSPRPSSLQDVAGGARTRAKLLSPSLALYGTHRQQLFATYDNDAAFISSIHLSPLWHAAGMSRMLALLLQSLLHRIAASLSCPAKLMPCSCVI